MHLRFLAVLLGVALALGACSSVPTGGEISGKWEGIASSSGAAFTLQLSQTSASVSGTLAVVDTAAVSLEGTFASSLLSLEGRNAAGQVNIEASVDGDMMRGTLAVTGENGDPVASPFTASR